MALWHVGTAICEAMTPRQAVPRSPATVWRLVAKCLSDYCAHLVAFVPDMLPVHGYDTRRVFNAVVMEAREHLAGCGAMRGRRVKLLELQQGAHCIGLLGMGAKLGSELR